MQPVISEKRWARWCHSKQLPVDTARFAVATCYYGFGLHSRPGTLLVTATELIHHSYSWRDTLWAMFEPSVRVSVRLADLREVRRVRIGFVLSLLQMGPDSAFRLVTNDEQNHELVLQERGDELFGLLGSQGVKLIEN
jgi:hypothetical protein